MASPGKRAFLFRAAPEVLDAVERLATADLRSVNAEMEVLIREALARRGIKVAKPSRHDDTDGDEPG